MRFRPFAARAICLVALLCAAVAYPTARDFQTVETDSLKITMDSDWAPRAAPGYLPIRFDISNGGDARVIEIYGQGFRSFFSSSRTSIGGSQGSTFISQSVRLAKGDRVKLTVPIPIYADSENFSFSIREGSRTLQRFNYTGVRSKVNGEDASLLFVASRGSAFAPVADRLARSSAVSRGVASSGAGVDAEFEPARLPASWLGYTSVRAVVLGSSEWERLTDGQKSALLTWTAAGGEMFLIDLDLKTVLPDARPEQAANPDRLTARHLLGRIHALTSAALGTTSLQDVLLATAPEREIYWSMPANTSPDWGALEWRGFRLRIPGVNGVPARTYAGILVLFTFLIGPVNYWLLWRKRQQVLMVLTTPIIAAVFIVVLAAFALAGNGLQVQGRAVTFTMLDEARKEAATHATMSFYAAGLTPSAGLRYSRDTAIYPLGTDGTGPKERFDMDLTEVQQFAGGILQARSPTNLEEVAVRPARERLTMTKEAGGLAVTNGLEAPILFVRYRDGDTLYSSDAAIAPGAKQLLRSAPFTAERPLPAGVAFASKFLPLLQSQPAGSYIAVLERSPFWEPGVSGLVEHGSVHVVLGWPEGQR